MTVHVTGPSGERERDDENDKRDERDDARREPWPDARCSGLLEGEADGDQAEPHADEARDQERAAAEVIDEGDRDEGREHVDARRSPRWWPGSAPRAS